MAARNAEDGISAAQVAESSLMEIAGLAQRLRELGVQFENSDILSDTDTSALDAEAAAIYDTIDAIIETTKFNGVDLLSHSVKSYQVAVADDGDIFNFNQVVGLLQFQIRIL